VRVIVAALLVALSLFGSGFLRGRNRVPKTRADVERVAGDLPVSAGILPVGLWAAEGITLSSSGFVDGHAGQRMSRQWMVYDRCEATCRRWIARTTSQGVQRGPLERDRGHWLVVFARTTEGCGNSRRGAQRQAFAFTLGADHIHATAIEVNNARFPGCRQLAPLRRADLNARSTMRWTAVLNSPICPGVPSCREIVSPGQPEVEPDVSA